MMTTGQPAPKTVDLYNKLIKTSFDDTAALGQFEWQLRSMRRHAPNDPEAAVCLLHVYMMLGKVAEAHDLIAFIWGFRKHLGTRPLHSFRILLIGFGEFERALAVSDMASETELPPYMWSVGLVAIGLGMGDLDIARQGMDSLADEYRADIEYFIAELDGAGLTPHFKDHQQTVLKVMGGRFSDYEIRPVRSDDGIELMALFFARADRKQRRLMEQEIDDALISYYTGAGVDPYAHTPLIVTSVMDISSRWPMPVV